jgi:PAS domain S-box-containing protein
LAGVVGSSAPYLTFYPAVVFVAWFAGTGPSVVAATLGIAATHHFFLGAAVHGAATREDIARAVVFFLFSVLFGWVADSRRSTRERSEERVRELMSETELRKRIEEELSRSRDLLHTTLASIGDAVISTDGAGRVTFLNAVAEALTGWTQAEAAGKAIGEVFVIRNEHTGAAAEIPVEKVIRQGHVVNLANHTVLRSRDGRDIPIEDSAAPIRGAETVLGAVLVFRDVTARRAAENALKQSEQRLKLALDAGRIGVWDWDIAGGRIEWSEQVFDMFGVEKGPSSRPAGRDSELVHLEDRARVEGALRAVVEKDVPYAQEFRITHPQRGIRWMASSGQVYRNERGEPVRLLGSVMDITDRKNAEAELLRQWHTFDTALSNTPDFNYVFDLEGRFTYANRARLVKFQMTLEQVIGKNFYDLGYPRHLAERFLGEVQRVIETKTPFRGESPMTWRSGETREYEYLFVPVLSPAGEVEAVVGTTHDITERKAAEQELKRSNEELTRVNRELEEFAYVASHDMQEPLRMVNIYTQLILDDLEAGPPALGEYAGFVKQGVSRMEGLIHDLLTFSRAVHADQSPLGTADLSVALREAMSVLQSRIEESGATIVAGVLPKVRGDAMQMAHVFQNLISNALKYRKRGCPAEVHVSAAEDGSDWIVSVRDNGIGFEPQYAERIFGLFKRLYKEEYPGTGIGLAICKRIVERYGGRIWAEGKPGEGATFFFALPKAE